MLYVNQKKYPEVPYQHKMKDGGAPVQYSNIASAGCGLCCMSMIVSNMTANELSLIACRDLSVQVKANMSAGTDLQILGPEVAKRYGLVYSVTDDISVLKKHLQNGGMAVANSGGDCDGYVGCLSHGGHYVVVVSVNENEYCILDPSWTNEKYHEEGREGRVVENYPFVYISEADLKTDCLSRSPSYYLFSRAKQ